MKRHIQKRFTSGLGAVLLAGLTQSVWAQPPGGPDFEGGPGRGSFGGPGGGRPGGRGNSPKFQLTRWMEDVQLLDATPQTALSKAQAKQLLALLSPWQKKKTMTDKEATALQMRLTAVLTSAQKSKLAAGGRFGGPEGPFGDGRPGGFGGGRRGGGDREGGFRNGGGRGGGPEGFFGDGPPDGGFGGPGGGFNGPGGFGGRGGPGGRGRGGNGPEGEGFGPPPGGFGGDGPNASDREARRASMQAFMQSNNPLASPKSNAQFAKLPEPMRQRMLERFKTQSDFLARLQKKVK